MTAASHTQTHQTSANVTDALWVRYRTDGDPAARAQLLDRYLGLVHHVAREIGARTPAVEVDELVSAGTLGLIRALDSFDLSRGLAFSTYAVRRIRGAILDDLRSRDWTPRSLRVKTRKLSAATAALQGRLGRKPEPREVAAELDISLDAYWEWRAGLDGNVTVSFDGGAVSGQRHTLPLEDTLNDPDAQLPGHELSNDDRIATLKEAIARLPEKERVVLALYFYEELNLRQIAEVLHVTESRISQIRSQALRRLQARLGHRDDLR